MTFIMQALRQKFRYWKADSSEAGTVINYGGMLLIGLIAGVFLGFAFGFYYPQSPEKIPELAKAQEIKVEFENRLQIHKQALDKLNEVNAELREKYLFLLGQLTLELGFSPQSKEPATLKHLSIVKVGDGVYQYRVLVVNQAHSVNTNYFLTFEFTSGESEKIPLDVNNFSLPQKSKKVIIPFLGKIEARNRKLKKTIFTIEENKKDIFKTEAIYEGK